MSAEDVQLPSQSQSALSALQPCSQSSLPALAPTPASVQSGTPAPTESDETDDLMLRLETYKPFQLVSYSYYLKSFLGGRTTIRVFSSLPKICAIKNSLLTWQSRAENTIFPRTSWSCLCVVHILKTFSFATPANTPLSSWRMSNLSTWSCSWSSCTEARLLYHRKTSLGFWRQLAASKSEDCQRCTVQPPLRSHLVSDTCPRCCRTVTSNLEMESFRWTRSRRGCVVSLRSRQCEAGVQALPELLRYQPGCPSGSNISRRPPCRPPILTTSALDTDPRGQSLVLQKMNHTRCLILRYVFSLHFTGELVDKTIICSSKEKLIGAQVTTVQMTQETAVMLVENILTSPVMSLLTVWSTTTILCSRKTKTWRVWSLTTARWQKTGNQPTW